MEITREEVYDIAVRAIKNTEVERLLENTCDKMVKCILDDDFNVTKVFYTDDTELMRMGANASSIQITVYPFYYSVVAFIRDYGGNLEIRGTVVERPVVSKAELAVKLVNTAREIRSCMLHIENILDRKTEN